MAGAWVFAEITRDGPHPAAFELLAHARSFDDDPTAIALGQRATEAAAELGAHGAATVYACDDPVFAEHPGRPAAHVLAGLIEAEAPDVVLFAQTYDSRDVAGRLQGCTGSALMGNATSITDPRHARAEIFGGTKIVDVELAGPAPTLILLRPKSIVAEPTGGTARVVPLEADVPEEVRGARIVERHEEATSGPRLEDAKVVLAGGRGLGGPDAFGSTGGAGAPRALPRGGAAQALPEGGPGRDARVHLLGIPRPVADDRRGDARGDRPPLDTPLPRARGLVRVPPGSLRDPRCRRGRDRVRDTEDPTAGPVPRLAHGGGGSDPPRDPRDRHDVVAVEREPNRAGDRGASRRGTDRRCPLRAVRGRPGDTGRRARAGVVAPAPRPGVPHLPAAVEASAHHHGGSQRLPGDEPPPRLPRAAPDRSGDDGRRRAARRLGRDRPLAQTSAGSVLVHGMWPLPGGLPGVE